MQDALWFDDLKLGDRVETRGRTVTEADLVNFCGTSGDFHALHTDAVNAEATQFGQRIAHGALVLSIVTGLRGRLRFFEEALVAFVEIRTWRFLAPVFIGDTVTARNEVTELHPTSKADKGIMVNRVVVLNQHGDVVQEGEMVSLVRKRV